MPEVHGKLPRRLRGEGGARQDACTSTAGLVREAAVGSGTVGLGRVGSGTMGVEEGGFGYYGVGEGLAPSRQAAMYSILHALEAK